MNWLKWLECQFVGHDVWSISKFEIWKAYNVENTHLTQACSRCQQTRTTGFSPDGELEWLKWHW